MDKTIPTSENSFFLLQVKLHKVAMESYLKPRNKNFLSHSSDFFLTTVSSSLTILTFSLIMQFQVMKS